MPIDAVINLLAKFWAFVVVPIYVYIRDSFSNEESQ